MHVLIIGKNGFIGKTLFEYLRSLNINVYAFDRNEWKKFLNSGLDLFFSDKKIDKIVYCAGFSSRFNCSDIDEIDEIENLFNCMRFKKQKLIYLSSSLVYGNNKSSLNKNYSFSEFEKCKPTGPYGLYKRIIERFILARDNTQIIRLTSCVGKSKQNSLFKVIHNKIINGEKTFKMLYADTSRDYIHVNTLVKVIYEIILKNSNHKIINIGSGKTLSVTEIIKQFSKKMKFNYEKIIFGEENTEDPDFHTLNINLLKNEISKNAYNIIKNSDPVELYLNEK